MSSATARHHYFLPVTKLTRAEDKDMRTLIVVVSLLVSGCFFASTKVAMVRHGETFPETQSVEILFEIPKKPFEKIAILETTGSSDAYTDMVNRLQKKGMKIGAHAIILDSPQKDTSLEIEELMTFGILGNNRILKGIAIRWRAKP